LVLASNEVLGSASGYTQGARYNFPMKKMILGCMLTGMVSLLCACGYKSDLVLPDDPEFKNRAKFPDVLFPSRHAEPPAKP
jgi:predicted small lipoprotein YifL